MSTQAAKVVMFLGVLGVATYFIVTKVGKDPNRDAKNRIEAIVKAAKSSEAAQKRLDDALLGPDLALVPPETAQRAGSEVIRLAAARATTDKADHANRLVRRYQLLPRAAQGGAALGELLTTLEGWATSLGKPEEGDARIAILRQAKLVADPTRAAGIGQKLATAKLEVARAKAESSPLEALALYVEEPVASTGIEEAGKLLATLIEAPSLLDEAGQDLDLWLAATKDAGLRAKIVEQRDLARAARPETEEEKTPAELLAMQKARPWDQRVAMRLALHDLDAGNAGAAEARLQAFGKPSLLVRDARMVLARIAMQQGKLDVADQLVGTLLGGRLQQFVAASAAFEQAAIELQKSVEDRLKSGSLPPDLLRQLETAPEAKQRELVDTWIGDTMRNDANLTQRREAMIALGDVVGASIFAGTIKVQRAQGLAGAARDAMLADAERTFLAVRTAAEGQPEYHLGLGEIYARLGKQAESEKEFQSVLDRKEDAMTIAVANIYRNIGNSERATKIATQLYETATVPAVKHSAAFLLYHLARNDEDQEKWLRAGDATNESVKIALLELEARKLRRTGDFAACDRKFAEAAKAHLAMAARSEAGYNNAALAHLERFACSGDVTSLKDAEQVLDRAYRAASDSPIVVANYASVLETNAQLRVLAKRIDIKAMKLTTAEAYALISQLLDGPERDAVLVDLAADPAWRRSAQLFAQSEVLQPNSTNGYSRTFARARSARDEAGVAAVLERLKRATKLDTSESVTQRKEFIAGTTDARIKEQLDSSIDRLAALAAMRGLSPRTLAAVDALWAEALSRKGVIFGDREALARAIELIPAAAKAWPALHADRLGHVLADYLGIVADKDRWIKLRRERNAAAVLEQLAAAGDPIIAKIKADAAWTSVATHLRAIVGKPSIADLRLARITGDADAIAKATSVLDDKLVRHDLAFEKIADPGQASTDEDLAFLDKR